MDRLNLQWFDAMAVAGSQFHAYVQAKGWPKLMSPNQIAALQRPGCDSTSLCKAIESACASGVLPSNKKIIAGYPKFTKTSIRNYFANAHDVTLFGVSASDLSSWLATSNQAPSQHILDWVAATAIAVAPVIPAPVLAASDGPAKSAAPVDRGWVMKRAALTEKHKRQWSTIKRDFQDANENGLSKAAKAPGHGDWFEADALNWARQRGKLSEATEQPSPIPATPFSGLTHRIKG